MLRSLRSKGLLFAVASLSVVVAFQNCSPVKFAPTSQLDLSSQSDTGPYCSFNGTNYREGEVVTGYQSSTVPFGQTCQSEIRECQEGEFTGSYEYVTCNVGGAASCLLNGVTIPDGQSVQRYAASSVGFGASCASETRTCHNGVLGGSYTATSCTVQTASSCTIDGQTIANGGSVVRYATGSVPYGSSCVPQTRTCANGVMSGTYQYSTCSAAGASSCLLNGQTIAHGGSTTAYGSSSVAYGSSCQSETRYCTNGSLSGSYQASNCSVSAAPTASCSATMSSQFITTDNLRISVSSSNASRVEFSCSGRPYTTLNNGLNDLGLIGESLLGTHLCSFRGVSLSGTYVNCNPPSITTSVVCPSGQGMAVTASGAKICRSLNNYNRWCYRRDDGQAQWFTIPSPGAYHAPGCHHADDGNMYAPGASIRNSDGTLTCYSQETGIPDGFCPTVTL